MDWLWITAYLLTGAVGSWFFWAQMFRSDLADEDATSLIIDAFGWAICTVFWPFLLFCGIIFGILYLITKLVIRVLR